MAENELAPELESRPMLKEAVCIDAMRIYDSCSEKQCARYKTLFLSYCNKKSPVQAVKSLYGGFPHVREITETSRI